MNAVKTMTRDAMLSYLGKKLKGNCIMAVEMDDTIVIKQKVESFKEWASSIWKEAKRQKLTEKDIKAIIKEARMSA